jgi:3-oxoacyl-[acyl-carrier-protein] synthase II
MKPFDRRRDGFIAGEGGAALLLEAKDHARARATPILGTVAGTASGIEMSADRKWGVPRTVSLGSMKLALAEASCENGDLAFICPHGSATLRGDRSELRAIMGLPDAGRSQVPICGMKGYTAHLGAASDIVEIILGLEAIRNGMVPATLNFRDAEEEFAGLNIPDSHQEHDKRHFMSLSYGLGGQCTAAVIRGER